MRKPYAFYGEQPLVIAHRGARDVAPENTLAAFQAALDADADGIELDVTRCATGEIVVIHDDTLDRTTNGSGPVAQTSFCALRALDAGAWFAPQFAGERVPLLSEVLDLVGHRTRINIEIKGRDWKGDGIEVEIARMVRERGLEQEVIISSFNPTALVRMHRAAPELQRGLLYAPNMPAYLSPAWTRLLTHPEALHPYYAMMDAEAVRRAQSKGCRVNVWTVNAPQDMQQMIALGVDAIITDHPAQLREMLPR
ncbi:MAG: glycerophosphodiester phosphodiesterase [Chloroflexi bacterium]|jgi:glycerophosphoryl diester phosphodiesterase|nr:glycerophosphodiester phosphodiesterase [Chloroflexota bacterium]